VEGGGGKVVEGGGRGIWIRTRGRPTAHITHKHFLLFLRPKIK
jgi:hypothetical protein